MLTPKIDCVLHNKTLNNAFSVILTNDRDVSTLSARGQEF